MPPKRQSSSSSSTTTTTAAGHGGVTSGDFYPADEFTRTVRKRLATSSRTGQACDRCKVCLLFDNLIRNHSASIRLCNDHLLASCY